MRMRYLSLFFIFDLNDDRTAHAEGVNGIAGFSEILNVSKNWALSDYG